MIITLIEFSIRRLKEKNLLHPTAMYDILTRMIFQGWKACEALSYNSARDSKTNNQNISSIELGYLKYFISWGDILNFLNTNLGVRLNVKDGRIMIYISLKNIIWNFLSLKSSVVLEWPQHFLGHKVNCSNLKNFKFCNVCLVQK